MAIFIIVIMRDFIDFLKKNKGEICTIYTNEGGFTYSKRVRSLPLEIEFVSDDCVRIGNREAQFIEVCDINFNGVVVAFEKESHHRCN